MKRKKIRRKKIKRSYRKVPETIKVPPHSIYLGEFDRITYVYETDLKGNCTKVINVSYEINIGGKWYLVSRYDSEHDFLHCHMRISTKDSSEIALNASRVIKKGTPKNWLTWAIRDIKKHFFEYRKGFLKRSKIKNLY